MNCTICGKAIILVPSAEERAKKDVSGRTAAYYRGLFTEHSDCTLKKRAEDTSKLITSYYTDRAADVHAAKAP